jgi:membrane-associated phospholipid phosphatase
MDIAFLSHFYTEGISPRSWWQVGLGYGSAITATETAGALKNLVGRDRPHPSPSSPSWPSQHATRAFAYSSSARAAFQSAGTHNLFSTSIVAMGEASAVGCAWARIESGAHYPSDVLAGAALGNFTTLFIQEAFDFHDSPFSLVVFPGPEEFSLQVGWDF